ncbi:FAD-binding Berberine family protein [Striga asiatica]|uniref:FAD-binding Berberine family protein n=1 Tax=Striga asiatica TaxID=4170 RepID=A0A5A7R8M8_STRAF|nr:FAD-binding Berberine family protein [Striga asiatica]
MRKCQIKPINSSRKSTSFHPTIDCFLQSHPKIENLRPLCSGHVLQDAEEYDKVSSSGGIGERYSEDSTQSSREAIFLWKGKALQDEPLLGIVYLSKGFVVRMLLRLALANSAHFNKILHVINGYFQSVRIKEEDKAKERWIRKTYFLLPFPISLKLSLKEWGSGTQDKSVSFKGSSLYIKYNIRRGVTGIGFSIQRITYIGPIGFAGQEGVSEGGLQWLERGGPGLEGLEQFADLEIESGVVAAIAIEGVLGADGTALEQHTRDFEMAGKAGIVERHRVPLIPCIHVHTALQ